MKVSNPSLEPRGVRVDLPIATMRTKPLPARSKDEIDRWRQYLRRRTLPRRAGGTR
jgi:hypothetical protein